MASAQRWKVGEPYFRPPTRRSHSDGHSVCISMMLQKQIHFAFFAKLDLENAAIAINAAISFCDKIALCSRDLSCWRVFVRCPRAQNACSRPIKMCVRRQTVWLWSISHRLIESTDVEER